MNSLKTIITRTTKASKVMGIDEGEISDAEKSLSSVGVAVRESDGEFRDFQDTMADLAGVWDDLSDVEKSNVAFALAGTRQINVIQSLLRSWDDYLSISEKAGDASGVTLQNQEKYTESLQGKMELLSTTAQSAWHNLIDDKVVSGAVSALQKLAEALDFLTSKLGLLGTVGLGAGIVALVKNIGGDKMRSFLL